MKYNSFKNKYPTSNSQCPTSKLGFTLIETLVAITILATAIAGTMTMATKGLSSAMFARDQVTAFYLAQEAVEIVRNKRDENTINRRNWLYGLNGEGGPDCFSNKCRADGQNNTISECAGSCSFTLQYDTARKLYGYGDGSDWEDTVFKREISLSPVNPNEIAITVELSWTTGLFDRTFRVKENILNWQ